MLQFDNEAARNLETIYSSPDVVAQRSATLERLRLRPGEEVIDVGCGPGFLCEQMADCVGPKGRVLGVDVSEDLLAFARGRNTRDWLSYSYGDASFLSLRLWGCGRSKRVRRLRTGGGSATAGAGRLRPRRAALSRPRSRSPARWCRTARPAC